MRLYKILFLFLALFIQDAFSQVAATNKQGGICFRIDDDQSITDWQQYAAVFKKYNYNFTFAIFIQPEVQTPSYISLIKNLQAAGNELADHTPNHITPYFIPSNPAKYKGLAGIDHIFNDTVAVAYDSFDSTTAYAPDGFANLVNKNMLISKKNGQFNGFSTSCNTIYAAVYLRSLHKLLSFSGVSNSNAKDPDTLYLTTLWHENVSLPNAQNIPIKMIGIYDIHMNINGLSLLAKCSLDYYSQLGISRPVTWIQPGGAFPQLSPQDAKIAFGIDNSYTSAGVYPNTALKCYNEYNPNGDRQYAMMWGDFYEDENSFAQAKIIIADRIAKHYWSIGHSHFSSLLGGWSGYLARMDSLLGWCKANNIIVKTYKDLAEQLYNTPQDPYTNIFPPLNVDLDGDGIPDGYGLNDGLFDTTSGVPESGNRSFSTKRKGYIFSISGLAGLEKGENDFYISTKGGGDDAVDVQFVFDDGKTVTLSFPAKSDWTRYGCDQSTNKTKTLIVPDDASYCDVNILCSKISDKKHAVQVSGFELHKKIYPAVQITSSPDTAVYLASQYKYQVSTNIKDKLDTLTYKFITSPSWLSIDRNGLVKGNPSQSGSYPVRIRVQDQQARADTQSYILSVSKRNASTSKSNINSQISAAGYAANPSVIPSNYTLYQNYPNPFNPSTTIRFDLKQTSTVKLSVYNILGQNLLEQNYGTIDAGTYEKSLNMDRYSSGIYFYNIQIIGIDGEKFFMTKKLMLMK
jgi:Putative Ig domain/Secretion system C-terminal sorting domain